MADYTGEFKATAVNAKLNQYYHFCLRTQHAWTNESLTKRKSGLMPIPFMVKRYDTDESFVVFRFWNPTPNNVDSFFSHRSK